MKGNDHPQAVFSINTMTAFTAQKFKTGFKQKALSFWSG